MLTFNRVSYDIVGRSLFSDLSLSFNSKKYGLVGPNGAGKSTFARLAARIILPTTGTVTGTNSVTYFSQDEIRPAITVAEYVVKIWNSDITTSPEVMELIRNISENKNLKNLSGGEWMRLRLAMTIIVKPDFLILDEPSNNLDSSGRKIIYDFIAKYKGAFLMISHDRQLLNLMDEILELSNQGISKYGVAYSEFEEIKHSERLSAKNSLAEAKKEKKNRKSERIKKILRQEKRMRDGKNRVPKLGLPKIISGARKRRVPGHLRAAAGSGT